MLTINPAGWLTTIEHCPSPNFNSRPAVDDISLLVIHNISLPAGEFATGHIKQLFTNTLDCTAHPSFSDLVGLTVSAHCLIERNGNIIQFVSFLDRAWHAGVSNYKGRDNCNDFSIGIELEGIDDLPYTQLQYKSLSLVTQAIMQQYPITYESITGHCDIAPGRKTDPGQAFDWSGYFSMLAQK